VLVLDEPTNHLDLDSIAWLEARLAAYEGAILFVSHDRDFIDAVAERVVELAGGTAVEYVGGFEDFVVQREERLATLRNAKAQQDRQLAQTERFIERFRYKATKARQVQSRIKALDKVERIEVPDAKPRLAKFAFPDPPRAGRVVVELAGVTAGYDDIPVLRDVDLVVERGTKVGVIGPNGAGKSTLLRSSRGSSSRWPGPRRSATTSPRDVRAAPGGRPEPRPDRDRGVQRRARRTAPGQERPFPARGVRVPGRRRRPQGRGAVRRGAHPAGARTGHGEPGEPADPRRADQPPRHPSRDVLEDALVDYPGTVLLVTHDRHVIRNTADMIVEVRDGRAEVHHGDYEDLLASRAYRAQFGDVGSEPQAHVAPTPRPVAESREDRAERKRREAERRNRLHRETGALRREAARLEEAVSVAEAEVAEINRLLADPAVYDDPTRARELVARHGEVKDRANDLMAQWERAHLELEAAEARVEQELGA
jgi:ATP-binding cassette, subfamily F, member 3